MAEAVITQHARFDIIRYAQLWEDADVLVAALDTKPGAVLVSICSAGDNALAMLTLDPARVVVFDLSQAQLDCLRLRIAAIRELTHAEFLELMGSRPSSRRSILLDRVLLHMPVDAAAFWANQRDGVIAHGAGGVGKFERYFRIFRRYLLPLVHSRQTVAEIFTPRDRQGREEFLSNRFNTRRWRWLLKLFFSRPVMGRMGRDRAFFNHVQGSVADHVAHRIRHAAVDCDPSQNPYLHWIMTGTHGAALPMPWRAEHYEVIRERLDRLELHLGPLERFGEGGEKADGYNLSDIFEYMPPDVAAQVYVGLLETADPGARLVYWNMMAPRRVPPSLAGRVRTLTDAEAAGKAQDKAFFYSDFVVEEVL